MEKGNFLMIHIDVLPDVFLKVIEAKELIHNDEVASIAEAVKQVGISRTILTISQSTPIDKKANVTITLDITDMATTFTQLTQELKSIEGVYKFTLDAIESTDH